MFSLRHEKNGRLFANTRACVKPYNARTFNLFSRVTRATIGRKILTPRFTALFAISLPIRYDIYSFDTINVSECVRRTRVVRQFRRGTSNSRISPGEAGYASRSEIRILFTSRTVRRARYSAGMFALLGRQTSKLLVCRPTRRRNPISPARCQRE